VSDTRRLTGERLADHTTIRLGGPAGSFVRAVTERDLIDVVAAADADGTPVLVLGGGSNVVVADAGFDGLVVQVATTGVRTIRGGDDAVVLQVSAGEPWDDVVRGAVTDGLTGLESLSGIPGLAGATPIQNVGAYGAEIGELVSGVRVFDRIEKARRLLSPAACEFGYRTSALKGHDRYVVLGVDLTLRPGPLSAALRYSELAARLDVSVGDRAAVHDVRQAVLELRAGKGMLINPTDPDSVSVGSFFTNPVLSAGELPTGAPGWPAGPGLVKTSAAWLIEQAGFGRGYGAGAVGLSTKHTLALVNRGGASTAELVELARAIRAGVSARFAVTLDVEPALIGVRL
jgi:UDP-N-acetylmuramate dehydrogenase